MQINQQQGDLTTKGTHMNTAVAIQSGAGVLEQVITKGNLAQLSEADRVLYYKEVCNSAGLNPFTKPFEFITLNGKLVLYALRGCTDQLRMIHKVSVEEMTESEREGVFIVTARVKNGEGRTDMAKGAVNIAGLKGEALANAMMKAETKAKRRATLSLCGLGMLDETEVETIPGALTPEPIAAKSHFKNASLRNSFVSTVIKDFESASSVGDLDEWLFTHQPIIDAMKATGNEHDELGVQEIRNRYGRIKKQLTAKEDTAASFGPGFAETPVEDATFDESEIPPHIAGAQQAYADSVGAPVSKIPFKRI